MIEEWAKNLGNACTSGKKAEVSKANQQMVEGLKSLDITRKMEIFEEENSKNPEFQVFNCYVRMVMEMMVLQRAVRTGDWKLHLASLEMFAKYFFAHFKVLRLHYARMIPLYLAEMKILKESDPELYQEFLEGNWVVNKKSRCGILWTWC